MHRQQIWYTIPLRDRAKNWMNKIQSKHLFKVGVCAQIRRSRVTHLERVEIPGSYRTHSNSTTSVNSHSDRLSTLISRIYTEPPPMRPSFDVSSNNRFSNPSNRRNQRGSAGDDHTWRKWMTVVILFFVQISRTKPRCCLGVEVDGRWVATHTPGTSTSPITCLQRLLLGVRVTIDGHEHRY